MIALLSSVVLGVALASSCGLRAFLPLFVTGLVARFTSWVELGDGFEWLTSTPALCAFGLAAILELSADKLPLIDNVLNAIQTPVRTAAGMLIYASVAVDLPLWVVAIAALIVGGGVALSVHVAKSAVRFSTSTTSGGALSPVVSIAEDIACLAMTLLSILLWIVAALIAIVGAIIFALSARTLWVRLSTGTR